MKNLDILPHSRKNDADTQVNKSTGGDQNSSQISNVEFGTLKKVGTNVSQASTFSNATAKSNPLVKLFTRNRSQSNVAARNSEVCILDAPDSKVEFDDNEPLKEPKITKLRAAKKILSPTSKSHFDSVIDSSSTDEGISKRQSSEESRGKKQIISSPSSGFHNLFHKSHSANGLSKFGDRNGEDKIHTSSLKASICLSSNNSNSVVNDIMLARVYKFTNANFSNEDGETFAEHSSLLDIHRKMLTPADSYIQNKLNKHHQHEIGLGIVDKSETAVLGMPANEEAKLNKSRQQICSLLKPLFIPSRQKKVASSNEYPFLGHSLDEIGHIIRNQLSSDSNRPANNVESTPKYVKYKSRSNKSSSKGQVLGADTHDSWLRRDVLQSVRPSENSNKQRGFDYLDMWQILSQSWFYYNKNIRFQILQIFQVVFTTTPRWYGEPILPSTYIDEVLQNSFCTVFIVPIVEDSKRRSIASSSVTTIASCGVLDNHEKSLFLHDPTLLSNALHCLGSLQALPQSSYSNTEIETHNLKQIMRVMIANLSNLS
ncbi:unnamed protein product [Candida parapsilosis]